jgi:hypothetical protein
MSENRHLRPVAPALPANISDWERKVNTARTLNDQVEMYHRRLVNSSPEYRAFLRAVWDEDTVEGKQILDDNEAARLIRIAAREAEDDFVGERNLATLIKALRVVVRRYGQSRKERRYRCTSAIEAIEESSEQLAETGE